MPPLYVLTVHPRPLVSQLQGYRGNRVWRTAVAPVALHTQPANEPADTSVLHPLRTVMGLLVNGRPAAPLRMTTGLFQ